MEGNHDMLKATFLESFFKDIRNAINVSDDHPPDRIASTLFSLNVTNDDIDNLRVVSDIRASKYRRLSLVLAISHVHIAVLRLFVYEFQMYLCIAFLLWFNDT